MTLLEHEIKPLILRDYQQAQNNAIRQSFAKGNRRIISCIATGSGKSAMLAELTQNAVSKMKRVIIVLPRRSLVTQLSESFYTWGINHGIVMSGHQRFTMPMVQIVSIDTYMSRYHSGRMDLIYADLCLIDECFTGETLIQTASGEKRIDSLNEGDSILNCLGDSSIIKLSKRFTYNEIIEIRLTNGKLIRCTKNHPIFTDHGWVNAGSLEVGTLLICLQNMYELWGGNNTENNEVRGSQRKPGIRNSFQEKSFLQHILFKEIDKPYVQRRYKKKIINDVKGYWSQACYTGRERSWHDKNTTGCLEFAWRWLERGIYSKNIFGKIIRFSLSLQNRFSKRKPDDCNRVRWWKPQQPKTPRTGLEKRLFIKEVRVESIEVKKQRRGTTVYNIQVDKHPSYFANGVLVHNCHLQFTSKKLEMFSKYPVVIGFSATPIAPKKQSLGIFYQDIIETISISELIDRGYLSPLKCYSRPGIDLSGLKTDSDGDYRESQLGDVMDKPQLVGDIYKNWHRLAKGKPTVIFASSQAHARHLCDEFNGKGWRFHYVDCTYPDSERQAIFKEVRNGQATGIVNVGIISVGIDMPNLECCVLARPTKLISVYLQCVGRVTRLSEGKQFGIVIDHAGIVEKLGLPTDKFEWSLDGSESVEERSQKSKEERKEPKEITCKNCETVFKSRRSCPECGHEIIQKGEAIPFHEADLVEIKAKPADKQIFFAQLLYHARNRGYSDGWAAHAFYEKFGAWPHKKRGILPVQPGEEVNGWIKFLAIRNAKRSAA